jgi:hypothetical protein
LLKTLTAEQGVFSKLEQDTEGFSGISLLLKPEPAKTRIYSREDVR